MPSHFVTSPAGTTSSGLTINLTVPSLGTAQPGQICLAVLAVGVSVNNTNPVEIPEGWQHAYSSPYDSLYHAPSNTHLHGALVWKILKTSDMGSVLTFTRTYTGAASFSGRLYVFRNDAYGFDRDDPFDVKLSRDTGLASESGTQLGVVTIPSGDVAVTCCAASFSNSGFWTRATGWTAPGGDFNGSTNAGLDLIYRVEAGSGDSVTGAGFFYLSNNRWVHWAFTFAEAPPPVFEPEEEYVAEAKPEPYYGEAFGDHQTTAETDVPYKIKQGDTTPPISATLKANKVVLDLTDATSVAFVYRRKGATTATTETATIDDATTGQVSYTWQAGDTDTAGEYEAEWVVTWTDGTVSSYPSVGYHKFEICESLA